MVSAKPLHIAKLCLLQDLMHLLFYTCSIMESFYENESGLSEIPIGLFL